MPSPRPANASSAPPARRPRLAVPLVMAVILVAFGRSAVLDFTSWDDPTTLWRNPDFNPPTLAGVLHYWARPHMGLYIPVTYSLWGGLASVGYLNSPDENGSHLNPWVFHGANVLLHLLAALTVLALLRRVFRRDGPAAVGALAFALHPLQVEAVAWASGTKDVLCGLLSLVALWQYLRYADRSGGNEAAPPANLRGGKPSSKKASPTTMDETPPAERPPRARAVAYLLATLAFVLAMLAKPAAVAAPLTALALDHWLLRRPWKKSLAALLPWALLAAPVAVIGRLAQSAEGVPVVAPWHKPLIAGDALAFYLYKLLVPLNLAVDYGRRPAAVLQSPWAYAAWLIPAALAVWLWRGRRRRPALLAAGAALLAPLLPVLGFVPFLFQYYSTVADHYLYPAMLGPALAAAWAVARRPTRTVYALAALVLLAWGVQCVVQEGYWQSDATLWGHAVAVNPASFSGHFVLAGRAEVRGDLRSAYDQDLAAVRANPDYPNAREGLVLLAARMGRWDEALAQGRELLRANRLAPVRGRVRFVETLRWLGGRALFHGNDDDALAFLAEVRFLAPDSPEDDAQWQAVRLALADQWGPAANESLRLARLVQADPPAARARYRAACAWLLKGLTEHAPGKDGPDDWAETRRALSLAAGPPEPATHPLAPSPPVP